MTTIAGVLNGIVIVAFIFAGNVLLEVTPPRYRSAVEWVLAGVLAVPLGLMVFLTGIWAVYL